VLRRIALGIEELRKLISHTQPRVDTPRLGWRTKDGHQRIVELLGCEHFHRHACEELRLSVRLLARPAGSLIRLAEQDGLAKLLDVETRGRKSLAQQLQQLRV